MTDSQDYDWTIPVLICTQAQPETVGWGIGYIQTEADFRDKLFMHCKRHGLNHLKDIYILMPGSPIVEEIAKHSPYFEGEFDLDDLCGELAHLRLGSFVPLKDLYDYCYELNERMVEEAYKVKKPTGAQFEQWLQQRKEN